MGKTPDSPHSRIRGSRLKHFSLDGSVHSHVGCQTRETITEGGQSARCIVALVSYLVHLTEIDELIKQQEVCRIALDFSIHTLL